GMFQPPNWKRMGLWKPGAGAPLTPRRERRRSPGLEASTVMRRRPDGVASREVGADGALPTPDPCAHAAAASTADSRASSTPVVAGARRPRLELVDSVITRC